ncbi:MAG: hypothetical protein ABEJ62_01065 [Candidatus Nanohaloarchaea archaeon]
MAEVVSPRNHDELVEVYRRCSQGENLHLRPSGYRSGFEDFIDRYDENTVETVTRSLSAYVDSPSNPESSPLWAAVNEMTGNDNTPLTDTRPDEGETEALAAYEEFVTEWHRERFDAVPVYRGIPSSTVSSHGVLSGDTFTIDHQAIESASLSPREAAAFAEDGIVTREIIDPAEIASSYFTFPEEVRDDEMEVMVSRSGRAQYERGEGYVPVERFEPSGRNAVWALENIRGHGRPKGESRELDRIVDEFF